MLPFENLGRPRDDGLVHGFHDELISALAAVPGLRVVSRTTARQYEDLDMAVAEIVEELDVDYVLEGSVLRAGDVVRINAQLVHAGRDEHVWASSYDRDVAEVLEVFREVAETIAAEVAAGLGPR